MADKRILVLFDVDGTLTVPRNVSFLPLRCFVYPRTYLHTRSITDRHP